MNLMAHKYFPCGVVPVYALFICCVELMLQPFIFRLLEIIFVPVQITSQTSLTLGSSPCQL